MQTAQIPLGYKLTEVGIIPSDWDLKQVGEIAQTTAGGTPSTLIKEYWGGDIKWMSSGELNLKQVYDVEGRITELGFNNSSTKILPAKSILIGLAGQGKTRGTVAINLVELCTNQSIAAILPSKFLVPEYLYHNLDNRYNELRNLSSGEGGRGGLNLKIIKSLLIALPPIEEQKRIAQVLSDIEKLIRSLDELIIKKSNIKQGTMQLLLTGKQRLPGYSGEWEVKTFDDCFKFLTTGSNARSDLSESGEVKYIHYGDIHAKKLPILDCAKDFIPGIARNKVKNLPLLEDGDLIIADASEDYQGLGKSIEIKNVNNCEIVAGLHTLLLRADKLVLADGFKAYITSIESVKNALIKIATGISVFGISKKAIKSIQLFLPPLEEQKAIARILSDMDEEIEVLEQKRNKYQDIKKGMMQELLTGKTRLV